MKGVPQKPLLSDDLAFVAAWQAAVAEVPVEKRAMSVEIMNLCFDIERGIRDISRTLRDCNVIMARTVGRMIQAEAEWNRA